MMPIFSMRDSSSETTGPVSVVRTWSIRRRAFSREGSVSESTSLRSIDVGIPVRRFRKRCLREGEFRAAMRSLFLSAVSINREGHTQNDKLSWRQQGILFLDLVGQQWA